MTDEVVSEVKPLSEIFGAKPEPVVKEPEPAKVDDQKPVDPPAEQGKGEKPGETPAPKPEEKKPDPPKEDDPIKVMRKALKATQRELAQLRQERETKPPPAAPDPLTDPDGFQKSLREQVADSVWTERVLDAEEELSEKLGDAKDETIDIFEGMMRARPQLYFEWRASRNPAKFIMKAVEDHRARSEMGDPKAYADKIRAETRKELMGEVEKMVADGIKKALGERLPQSLADEQTQGGGRSEPPSEFKRKPLDQILKR